MPPVLIRTGILVLKERAIRVFTPVFDGYGPRLEGRRSRASGLMLSDGRFAVFVQRPLALGMLVLAGVLMVLTLLPRPAARRGATFTEAAPEE